MRPRHLLCSAAALSAAAIALWGMTTPPGYAAEPTAETPLVAAPNQATHPTADSLWADSSAGDNEQGVNGTVAALIDDDPASPSDATTFWNTNWNPSVDYPHALAFDTAGMDQVCGVAYTSRPSYSGASGEILGAKDSPASYKIYALKTASLNDETWANEWKAQVANDDFRASDLVASGGLTETNEPQIVTFAPTSADQIVLVGLHSLQDKPAMSASDIKVVPCQAAPEPQEGSGSDTLINDLYLQRQPFTQQNDHRTTVDFAASQHTYYATAFYHSTTVVPHVTAVQGATVTINGAPANDNGERTITLTDGWNPIVIDVTKGNESATYVINVHKVDTDYRGREVVPNVAVTTNDGTDGSVMFDSNEATWWSPSTITESSTWSTNATGFTLTFDQPRNVSKITGSVTFTSGRDWDAGRVFQVWGSADGVTFDKELATKATLRNDTIPGYIYWDFNRTETVKAIRVWATPSVSGELLGAGTNIRFKELQVWQNAGNAPEVLPAQPTGDTTSQMYDPTADAKSWGVSRAQALFMKYGVIAPTWVPSEGYARGSFDAAEQAATGGAFPMFYDPPLFDSALMSRIPDSYWALAKAPGGGNSMAKHTHPEAFLTDEMLPYAKNLIDIQYGDEGDYSTAERDRFAQWFAWSKENLPGAIVHSNQYDGGGWPNVDTMSDYVKVAKPDVITWDTYDFSYGNASKDDVTPAQYVLKNAGRNVFSVFRQVAMQGYDGEGADPVPWGQYIDYSFNANMSESQKNFTAMLSLTAGAKWLGNFRMEYASFDRSTLVDADGAPTRSWYEYATTFKAQRNLGNYLTALNHKYLATQPGDYGSGTNSVYTGYKAGAFADAATGEATKDWGILNISASSAPNGMNAGRPGDVVVGYFDKLPGLSDTKTAEIFGEGTTNPKAFMVMNALAGKTLPNAKGLDNRYDNGADWQTRQDITVTVKAPQAGTTLYRVDHATGDRSAVALTAGENGTATFTVSLDGGMADLFYWGATTPTTDTSAGLVSGPNPGESGTVTDTPATNGGTSNDASAPHAPSGNGQAATVEGARPATTAEGTRPATTAEGTRPATTAKTKLARTGTSTAIIGLVAVGLVTAGLLVRARRRC